MIDSPEIHLKNPHGSHGHEPVITELMRKGKTEHKARDLIAGELRAMRKNPLRNRLFIEQRRKTEEAKNLSAYDSLTRLHSRRFLLGDEDKDENDQTRAIGELEQEFIRAQRYRHNLTLFLIDLDFFKQVNDSYGHQAGDQLLKTFADAARKVFRKSDILARYGGDEFCFVLPETNSEQAIQLVERLKKEYNALQTEALKEFKIDKPNSLSIGVSSLQSNSPTNHLELIKFADEVLYKVKKAKIK